MSWGRRIAVILFPLFLIGVVWRVWYLLTGGFTLGNIHTNLPYHHSRDVLPLSSEEHAIVLQAFQQPYTYIGKGAQCFAFISQDGKYVLKFFKSKHHKPSFLTRLLPDVPPFAHYLEKKQEEKKQQLDAIFRGYLLAYESLGPDSGLLFLHFNGGGELPRTVSVRDGMGWRWHIPLREAIFVLQRYSDTLGSVLDYALQRGNSCLAKERLKQVVDMYVRGYRKKIYDRDHAVVRNVGFASEQPIHLDVGHLTQASETEELLFFKKDINKTLTRIDNWCKQYYPQYRKELMGELYSYVEISLGSV